MSRRHGFTLLEMLLVLAILGVLTGVATLRWSSRPAHAEPTASETAIARARGAAIRSGRPVTIRIAAATESVSVTAYPDGSVLAPRTAAHSRLTGRPDASR